MNWMPRNGKIIGVKALPDLKHANVTGPLIELYADQRRQTPASLGG
jgi:hypothetical protein